MCLLHRFCSIQGQSQEHWFPKAAQPPKSKLTLLSQEHIGEYRAGDF